MAFGTSVALKALLPNGEIARFTMRFTRTTEPTPGDLINLADEIATDDGALIAANWSSDIVAFSISTQNFTHVTPGAPKAPYWGPSSAEFSNSVAIGPGTKGAGILPPQNAVVATLRTGLPGRSHLGRLFGFPPLESEVDGAGNITGAYDLPTIVNAIKATVEGSANIDGAQLAVFSAKLDSSTPVFSVVQGGRIDTQRRRLARTG